MRMAFTEEERAVDESLGYPKAYAKLCKSPNLLCPYSNGPPFAYLPYMLQPQEALKIKDLNEMFPILDPEAVPSVNPKGFVNLLWKQLDHLGNAGFDPALFRVDPFGNVLYLHADSASPLAWDIDHWFPSSRGGKTVLSNLRIVNSQVCKKKGNKLEFLIPWWDLQIGISINQFLNIFSSKNSDFRKRAFSYLFLDGQNEELNALQSVESHLFPQHFNEAKNKLGLAPAAIVSSRSSDHSVLKQVDLNRVPRPTYPLIASKKFSTQKPLSDSNSDSNSNPHHSISLARDSLIHQTRTKIKTQSEIQQIDKEISEMRDKNEEERLNLADLEELLMRKKRRAEKCRQLADAQAGYKGVLEKMIRDAMHQSVIYKEQLRLNQSATSALMARLEAQRAICDSSENELRKKFKNRGEIELQVNSNQARKRSRIDLESNDEFEFLDEKTEFRNNGIDNNEKKKLTKKELRKWLEEEQRNSEFYRGYNRRYSILDDKLRGGAIENNGIEEEEELQNRAIDLKRFYIEREDLNEKLETMSIREEKLKGFEIENEIEEEEEYVSEIGEELQNHAIRAFSIVERGEPSFIRDGKLHGFAIENEIEEEEEEFIDEIYGRNKLDVKGKGKKIENLQDRAIKSIEKCEIEEEEEEEFINEIGKENVDKWLQILVNNSEKSETENSEKNKQNESKDKEREILGFLKSENARSEENYNNKNSEKNKQNTRNSNVSRNSFDLKDKENLGFQRSDSSRAFRSLPASPSKIFLGMKKGVDCIGRKPKVLGDDEEISGDYYCNNNSRKFGKGIKKALIK